MANRITLPLSAVLLALAWSYPAGAHAQSPPPTDTAPQITPDGPTAADPALPELPGQDDPLFAPQATPGVSAEQLRRAQAAIRDSSASLQEQLSQLNQPGQPFADFGSPEMARKARAIRVLRELLALRITAGDLSRAIPILHKIETASAAKPIAPEQALEAEYQALLKAKPGDPVPSGSAEALRAARDGTRSEQDKLWNELGRQIGKEKAAGLRQLAGSNPTYITVPDPNLGRREFLQPEYLPKSPRSLTPGGPQLAPQPAAPARPPMAVPDQDPTHFRTPGAPGAGPDISPGAVGITSPTAPLGQPLRAPTGLPPGTRITAVFPDGTVGRMPGASPQGQLHIYRVFNQISLPELIDIMQKKLEAMR